MNSQGLPEPHELEVSLLGYNYFPQMSRDKQELPPSINSSSFTPQVAKKLTKIAPRKSGYDAITYNSTRFNLVPRVLSIPHPLAYARLVTEMTADWQQISDLNAHSKSPFRPILHKDGRVTSMDYGTTAESNVAGTESSRVGANYRVSADISNFYPSIYTHSIPWALVGKSKAKQDRNQHDYWYNRLDKAFRQSNRNETTGVQVGPGTSFIAAEIILSRIDSELDYEYVRHIDDYTYYAVDHIDAEQFVLKLSNKLREFNLHINPKKTTIDDLPQAKSPAWIRELLTNVPLQQCPDRFAAFIDSAVELGRENPEASTLKFVINRIFEFENSYSIMEYLLNKFMVLSFHRPILIPALDKLAANSGTNMRRFSSQLNKLVKRHAAYNRSDAMSWTLHIMRRHQIDICEDAANAVLETRDCLSLLLLYKSRSAKSECVEKFCNGLLGEPDDYDRDKYWLVLYELYRLGKIVWPHKDDETFDILFDNGVAFME